MSAIQEIFNRPRGGDRRFVALLRRLSPALVKNIKRTRSAFEAAELLDELTSAVNRSNLPDVLRFELITWLLGVSGLAGDDEVDAACVRKPDPRQIELSRAV